MGLYDLFIASLISVSKILLITVLGAYLALDRVNILGKEARVHVNIVVFYVFTPALIGSKLAESITYDSMVKMWFMPFNVLITFVIGSLFGWIVTKFTRPPKQLRGLVIGCCAAGNMGNMLLVMIPAVCKEKGSPFGSPDFCQFYGLAYVSLSMAMGSIFLWTYVYNILRVSSTGNEKESNAGDVNKYSRDHAELGGCTEPLIASTSEVDAEQHGIPVKRSDGITETAESSKSKHQLMLLFKSIQWKSAFAPSTIGALIGFGIGLIPPIRSATIGDDAPFRMIQDSVSLIGDGAIPALTLIIGGNLLKGLQESVIPKWEIFGIIVARYVALPLTGILIVKGAYNLGFIPDDPLYQFVLLLHFALPPAMNIGTITQLFGAGETECSIIFLWCYVLASVSLTFWSTLFMWLLA